MWRLSPVEDWHADSDRRFANSEMMRANVATTRLVRDLLDERLAWPDDLDGDLATAVALLTALYRAIVDSDRRLPDGRTVLELASSYPEYAKFDEHVRSELGAWVAMAAERGMRAVLMMLAGQSGGGFRGWWLTPEWPSVVEHFAFAGV
jgi:hypothetical protein